LAHDAQWRVVESFIVSICPAVTTTTGAVECGLLDEYRAPAIAGGARMIGIIAVGLAQTTELRLVVRLIHRGSFKVEASLFSREAMVPKSRGISLRKGLAEWQVL
jgi:hypothetical protein